MAKTATASSQVTGQKHPGGGVYMQKTSLDDAQIAIAALMQKGVAVNKVGHYGPNKNCFYWAEVSRGKKKSVKLIFERLGNRLTYSGREVDGVYHSAG